MTDSMIDRVARALRFVMYGVPVDRSLDAGSMWLTYAKSAIEAMRPATTSEWVSLAPDDMVVGLVMRLTGGSAEPRVIRTQLARLREAERHERPQ